MTENKRKASLEANLKAIIENTLDNIWAIDRNYEVIYINEVFAQAFFNTFGVKLEPGMNILDRLPDPLRGMWKERYDRGLNNERYIFEDKIELGRLTLYIEVAVNPIVDDGAVKGVSLFARDITERKQFEKNLKIFMESVDNSSDAIGISTPDGKHYYQNRSFDRLFGKIGDNPPETLYADKKTGEEVFAAIIDGIEWVGEVQMNSADNKILDIFLRAYAAKDENGKITALVGVHTDITEQKKAEKRLLEHEKYLRAVLDNFPFMVWLKDKESRILAANNAYAKVAGVETTEELVGKTDLDYWEKELADHYRADDRAVLESGEPKTVEEEITEPGRRYWIETYKSPVELDGEIIGTVGFARDITERKEAEEVLSNIQKLESLGILAGGIAHDFNNLMGGVFGFIDLAKESSDDTYVKDCLDNAMSAINRARGLTRQLLTFAKGGEPVKKTGHLFPFIQETALFALSGSNVSCSFDIAENLWVCDFDRNQIGQVFDNIIINAQQAMPLGGTIEITARNVSLFEKEHAALQKGEFVKISVKDRGIGIQPELLSRIFDPFFTTKSKGHGLGLSTCYSIISRHGGAVDVESQQGTGSTFHIFLPVSFKEVKKSKDVNYGSCHKGSGTFLVMDDELIIREITKKMLTNLGYEVVCKENGKEAVDFVKNEIKSGRKLSGMIFDLTIPGGMGGKKAIEEIRKICADVPAFVSSGYDDDPVMKDPLKYGFTASICKPFNSSELTEMLEKYLKTDN
jgi:PAS domain S-box-containing protein